MSLAGASSSASSTGSPKNDGGSQGIWVAYGSNLPFGNSNALQGLALIVKRLGAGAINVEQISKLWRSAAWPDPSQPDFVNAVMRVRSHLAPKALLETLHEIESEFGRDRGLNYKSVINAPKNAPRTVDLDLVAYNDLVIPPAETDDNLGMTLPHPRAHARGFVMGPLAEIAPDWVHPVLKLSARELYARVTVGVDAVPYEATDGVLLR